VSLHVTLQNKVILRLWHSSSKVNGVGIVAREIKREVGSLYVKTSERFGDLVDEFPEDRTAKNRRGG